MQCVLQQCVLFYFTMNTVEICIEAPVFMRTLRLKFHCLNPLSRNPKEAEMGMVFIRGFHAVDLEAHEWKFS